MRPIGIEPITYRSEVCRSIQLSYERKDGAKPIQNTILANNLLTFSQSQRLVKLQLYTFILKILSNSDKNNLKSFHIFSNTYYNALDFFFFFNFDAFVTPCKCVKICADLCCSFFILFLPEFYSILARANVLAPRF